MHDTCGGGFNKTLETLETWRPGAGVVDNYQWDNVETSMFYH